MTAQEQINRDEDERELRGLWLSRVMFNQFVGWPSETRTFEQFAADVHESERTDD